MGPISWIHRLINRLANDQATNHNEPDEPGGFFCLTPFLQQTLENEADDGCHETGERGKGE